jgi:23S rRNA pseudouridine2605 synthase
MARAGHGSRRACEEIIEQGRVTVNSQIASLGMRADPDRDDIRVDGSRLHLPESYTYIMLNKPRGVISDEDVGGNFQAARELIPLEGRLYPVGRLDVPSEGLMLFTDDGDLAHRLTHPRYEHPKTYHVLVEGMPSEKTLEAWRRGVVLDGKPTAPGKVRQIRKTRDRALLEVTVTEGRKRLLRRVAAALGHPVHKLVRVKLGPLELGDLPAGAWRRLTDEEVAALQAVRTAPAPRRKASGGSSQRRRSDSRHGRSGKRSSPQSKRGTRRK